MEKRADKINAKTSHHNDDDYDENIKGPKQQIILFFLPWRRNKIFFFSSSFYLYLKEYMSEVTYIEGNKLNLLLLLLLLPTAGSTVTKANRLTMKSHSLFSDICFTKRIHKEKERQNVFLCLLLDPFLWIIFYVLHEMSYICSLYLFSFSL